MNADPGGIGRITTAGRRHGVHDGLTTNSRPVGIADGLGRRALVHRVGGARADRPDHDRRPDHGVHRRAHSRHRRGDRAPAPTGTCGSPRTTSPAAWRGSPCRRSCGIGADRITTTSAHAAREAAGELAGHRLPLRVRARTATYGEETSLGTSGAATTSSSWRRRRGPRAGHRIPLPARRREQLRGERRAGHVFKTGRAGARAPSSNRAGARRPRSPSRSPISARRSSPSLRAP